jgi:hypothetical protein
MRIAGYALLMCLLLSCGDDPLDYPNARGDIEGYFRSIDQNGVVETAPSGLVILDGRTTRLQYGIAKGEIHFNNVPAGNYRLKISKKGYDPFVYAGLEHLGGSPTILNFPNDRITVSQKPAVEITDWSLSYIPGPTTYQSYFIVQFGWTGTYSRSRVALVMVVSDQPGVTSENYQEVFFLSGFPLDPATNQFLAEQSLFGNRLLPGKTYYASIYPYNYGTTATNPETGRLFIPSLGNVAVEKSFVAE